VCSNTHHQIKIIDKEILWHLVHVVNMQLEGLILDWIHICDYIIYFRFMELLVHSTSNTHNGSRPSKLSSPSVTPRESFPLPDVVRTLEELFTDKNLGPQPGVVTCNQPLQQQHYLHHHHHNGIQVQVINWIDLQP
jgi:hypothetical protein